MTPGRSVVYEMPIRTPRGGGSCARAETATVATNNSATDEVGVKRITE
jgi:hypothetical protein